MDAEARLQGLQAKLSWTVALGLAQTLLLLLLALQGPCPQVRHACWCPCMCPALWAYVYTHKLTSAVKRATAGGAGLVDMGLVPGLRQVETIFFTLLR